jgi:hypothetical protein
MAPELKKQTYCGFEVLAIDGTTLTLPKSNELINDFGVLKSRSGVDSYPKARASVLYDCLNDTIIDPKIDKLATGEHTLFYQHLDLIDDNPNRILVIDRGYESVNIFKKIISKKSHFCCRMRNQWRLVKGFIQSDDMDTIIDVRHPGASIRKAKKLGLDTENFKVRLVKIELEDSIEILATSLLDPKYDLEFFKKLYHLRWRVEESYKTMKCRIKIEKFMGKSTEAIKQEFYGKIMMLNITIAQIKEAEKQVKDDNKGRKFAYKINVKAALSKVKRVGVILFNSTKKRMKDVLEILTIKMISDLTPIRPNRRFPHRKRISTAIIQNYGTI